MKKWKHSGIVILMLSLLAMSIFALTLSVKPARADDPVYTYAGYIYINANGTITPSGAPISIVSNTYTFSENITAYGIVVNRSYTVLDGHGYTLQDTSLGSHIGVDVIAKNVTVQNIYITEYFEGVELTDISNSTISRNTITNNYYGIYPYYSSNGTISHNNVTGNYYYGVITSYSSRNHISYNKIANNTDDDIFIYGDSGDAVSYNNVTGSYTGIYTSYSSGDTVSHNKVVDNTYCGIYIDGDSGDAVSYNNVTGPSEFGIVLYYSSDNTLTGNAMVNNGWNFLVQGSSLPNFLNNVDKSNTVNTKPIYYWINVRNAIVPSNASCVLLVNCTNIQVKSLTLEHAQGVLLAQTTNCTITQNLIANNYYGSYLCLLSDNNTITGDTITGNYQYGIYIDSSSGNTVSYNKVANDSYGIYNYYSLSDTISHNNVTGNSNIGMYIDYCSGDAVSHNNFTDDYYGIEIYSCSADTISYNNFTDNLEEGIYVYYSPAEAVSYNNVTGSYYGIQISFSPSDTISHNNVTGSGEVGIQIDQCLSDTVSYNKLTGGYDGIYTDYSLCVAISYNSITSNSEYGIYLGSSSEHNTLIGNTIGSNGYAGIGIATSSDNLIYHNNFVNNVLQVSTDGSTNTWDNGYPSGGNYWSDYNATRLGAVEIDSSGTWNTPYTIDINNTDHYPLMHPWFPAPIVSYLVVRGEDDAIYYRLYSSTSASWGSWNRVPDGATPDSPAAVVCSNTLYMAVRGEDGASIYFGSINLTNNVFSGWTLLSGATPSAPTLASNGTTLALVVRGEDNGIYYRFYDIASATWTDWVRLPSGATCDSPAAAVLANTLHIVVRGMDGSSIWHCSVNLNTGAFSGWELVAGATPSRPTLTACGSLNELCLVVKGMDNATYYETWNALGWSGWTRLQTGFSASSPAATVVGEQLQLTVRHAEAGEYLDTLWSGTVDLTTGAFSGWTLISGDAPSAPTLTS